MCTIITRNRYAGLQYSIIINLGFSELTAPHLMNLALIVIMHRAFKLEGVLLKSRLFSRSNVHSRDRVAVYTTITKIVMKREFTFTSRTWTCILYLVHVFLPCAIGWPLLSSWNDFFYGDYFHFKSTPVDHSPRG